MTGSLLTTNIQMAAGSSCNLPRQLMPGMQDVPSHNETPVLADMNGCRQCKVLPCNVQRLNPTKLWCYELAGRNGLGASTWLDCTGAGLPFTGSEGCCSEGSLSGEAPRLALKMLDRANCARARSAGSMSGSCRTCQVAVAESTRLDVIAATTNTVCVCV
jgi:hypothetical protein